MEGEEIWSREMITLLFWVVMSLILLIHIGGVIGWLRAPVTLPRLENREPYSLPASGAPLVSVIIPARNEEEVIEGCVRSYLAQDYPSVEVIVVDDRSTDSTSGILAGLAEAYPDFVVVSGAPHPDGWTGKNFAAHQGYSAAKGEYFLFSDADTLAEPGLVSAAMDRVLNGGIEFLTCGSRPIFQSFWDRAVIPMIGQFFFILIRQANNPDSRAAGANGPFLFFKRDVYNSLGGHEGMKGEILEDQVFGEKAKEAGFNLELRAGHKLLSQYFYSSLPELWEGWVKILYYNISRDRKILKNILTPFNLLLIFFVPWFSLGSGIIMAAAGIAGPWPGRLMLMGGAQCFTSSAAQELLRRYLGIRGAFFPPAQPVAAAILTGIWFDAVYRFVSGRAATWKGRSFVDGEPASESLDS